MGILDRLTDGNVEKNDNENLYNVYVQFDKDDPLLLALDIDVEQDFIMELHPEDKNFISIKDSKTGKEIKIFAKKHSDE